MNVETITESMALTEGADLWIIKNDPSNKWWKKLDFASGYLFSKNYFKSKKETPSELINIIEATRLNVLDRVNVQNYILLGTQDHFLNRWTLVWNNINETQLVDSLLELSQSLKFDSIRIFHSSGTIMKILKTRPSASSLNISYIENT